MGVPRTTAKALYFAPTKAGGLGWPSFETTLLGHPAREMLVSLEGNELAAQVRRGRWQVLASLPPRDIERDTSRLRACVQYLAQYGFYVEDHHELTATRIAHATRRLCHPSLELNPFLEGPVAADTKQLRTRLSAL